MSQNSFDELKEKLLTEKNNLETELKSFATPDKKLKGDWDTKFPTFGDGESGNEGEGSLDSEADEVEQYESQIAIEHSLETKLKKVNEALDKIASGKYGLCENCRQAIDPERLKVVPEAKLCMSCENK